MNTVNDNDLVVWLSKHVDGFKVFTIISWVISGLVTAVLLVGITLRLTDHDPGSFPPVIAILVLSCIVSFCFSKLLDEADEYADTVVFQNDSYAKFLKYRTSTKATTRSEDFGRCKEIWTGAGMYVDKIMAQLYDLIDDDVPFQYAEQVKTAIRATEQVKLNIDEQYKFYKKFMNEGKDCHWTEPLPRVTAQMTTEVNAATELFTTCRSMLIHTYFPSEHAPIIETELKAARSKLDSLLEIHNHVGTGAVPVKIFDHDTDDVPDIRKNTARYVEYQRKCKLQDLKNGPLYKAQKFDSYAWAERLQHAVEAYVETGGDVEIIKDAYAMD